MRMGRRGQMGANLGRTESLPTGSKTWHRVRRLRGVGGTRRGACATHLFLKCLHPYCICGSLFESGTVNRGQRRRV